MDERGVGRPRRYEVRPRRVLTAWGSVTMAIGLLMVSLVVFTPLRELIPGYGTDAIRRQAVQNDKRVAALSDSLRAQQRYIQHLRSLITGRVDTSHVDDVAWQPEPRPAPRRRAAGVPVRTVAGHPASAMGRTEARPALAADTARAARLHPLLPARPPVDGFVTRGYDASARHYGIDIAVTKGTPVRVIGSGYVIFADWTQAGGYTVAVQHIGGLVSIYKHNRRLLKQLGDRVRARETIAISGNSGEITSGPHVHVEFWRDGLAQNPRQYLVGL